MTLRRSRYTSVFTLIAGVLTVLWGIGITRAQQRNSDTDWPVYGGNAEGTRFSRLTQINRSNVGQLEVAWQFDPLEGPVTRFQAQPIVVDGVLYTPSPGGFSVIALDGRTGKLKWSWNAGTRTAVRGVAGLSPVLATTVGLIFTRISGAIPNVSQ